MKKEVTLNGQMVIHRFSMMEERTKPVARALRYFLCALKQFNRGVLAKDARSCDVMFISTEEIRFVLVGDGAYKQQVIEKLTATYGGPQKIQEDGALACGPFYLLPFQPYEDISHVFSLGDVSLVISKPGIGSASVPSKTWSIMSASRPVLAHFDENELKTILEVSKVSCGEAAFQEAQAKTTLIQHGSCGIFTKAGDKVAFADAILKLYNDRDLCREMGRNGRRFVMDNLTREVSTQKYVDVIKSFEKGKN